jgi:hypothetical protein
MVRTEENVLPELNLVNLVNEFERQQQQFLRKRKG